MSLCVGGICLVDVHSFCDFAAVKWSSYSSTIGKKAGGIFKLLHLLCAVATKDYHEKSVQLHSKALDI